MPAPDEKPTLADALVAEYFALRDGRLIAGGIAVDELAQRFGTPLFVYDAGVMKKSFARLSEAVAGFAEIYFSIKANPNPAVAAIFVAQGAGIEIASAGEYARARRAGADPNRILFAGPGKRDDELDYVIAGGIGEIHLESFEEIAQVEAIAVRRGTTVPVSIRINPVAAAQGGAMRMGGKPAPFGFDEEQVGEVLKALAATTASGFLRRASVRRHADPRCRRAAGAVDAMASASPPASRGRRRVRCAPSTSAAGSAFPITAATACSISTASAPASPRCSRRCGTSR